MNEIKAISTANAPAAIGPYSQAVRAGDFLYLSGCLGVDPATGELEKDVCAQFERAVSNMKAILAEAGADISRVVKTTVFLKNMSDFAAVNAIYAAWFGDNGELYHDVVREDGTVLLSGISDMWTRQGDVFYTDNGLIRIDGTWLYQEPKGSP